VADNTETTVRFLASGKSGNGGGLPLPNQPGDITAYLITSSARARIAGGMLMPSALAVFALTASANFPG